MYWFKLWYNREAKIYMIISGNDVIKYVDCNCIEIITPQQKKDAIEKMEKGSYLRVSKEFFHNEINSYTECI